MRYIIIGNSAAGNSAAENIRLLNKQAKISIISNENFYFYSKSLLPYYIANKIPYPKLFLKSKDFYKKMNIDLILNQEVIKVEPDKQRIKLKDGKSLNYDKLLMATGASPIVPQIPGTKLKGVCTLRTLNDANKIISLLPETKEVIVLGGGPISIKLTEALTQKGLKVTLIIKSKWPLSRMIDAMGGQIVAKFLKEKGILVLTSEDIKEIIGKKRIQRVKLCSEESLDCQLLLIGKGVTPNIESIKDTKIEVNQGIKVDAKMKTNITNIFAAGDVAETMDIPLETPGINALWPLAVEQGKIAGMNMTGESAFYAGSIAMNSLVCFGLEIISAGMITKIKENAKQLIFNSQGRYKKFVLIDNILKGFVLIKDIKGAGIFLELIRKKAFIPQPEILLNPNFHVLEAKKLLGEFIPESKSIFFR